MGMLLSGLVLLAAAVFLMLVARPQADGSPARFLSHDSVMTCYALLVTAFVGLGLSLFVGGAGKVVTFAAALAN